MSSSQINYFFTDDDIKSIEDQLCEYDLLILPYESLVNKMEFIDSIFNQSPEATKRVNLVHKNHLDKVVLNHYPANEHVDYDRYIVDFLSPVIEFSACYINEEEKFINRSRIYYKKGFWNKNKEWELQPEEFLNSAENLFKWIRRNIKKVKIEELKGFYVSENAKKMIDTGWRLKDLDSFYPSVKPTPKVVSAKRNNIKTVKPSNFADAV